MRFWIFGQYPWLFSIEIDIAASGKFHDELSGVAQVKGGIGRSDAVDKLSDFFKKLNTLQKAIRAGRWEVPVVLQVQTEKKQQQHTHDLQRQYRELTGEHAQLSQMLESLRQRGQEALSDEIETQQHACQQRLDVLHQGLLNSEEANA